MPEMDGLAATAAIRKAKRQRNSLPIFAMTAHAMKGDRERCLDAGMDGYIAKPVRFSDIEQTLAGLTRECEFISGKSRKRCPGIELEALERIGGDQELLRIYARFFWMSLRN